MAPLSQCHDQGLLLVLLRPKSPRFVQDFHHWYNTEHGPARLRLGSDFFENGYRYKEAHSTDPVWLAIYDMKRLSAGADSVYTTMRENRSQQEQTIFAYKVQQLSRQFLKLIAVDGVSSVPAKTLCVASLETKAEHADSVQRWYCENAFPVVRQEYGCVRSRIFKLIDGTNLSSDRALFTCIHDLDSISGEQSLISRIEMILKQNESVLPDSSVRLFNFYHEFSAVDYRRPACSDAKSDREGDSDRAVKL